MTASEPRNPFYLLLLVTGVLFCATALAYTAQLSLEKWEEAVAASPFQDALRADGWKWLLYEVAALIVLGLASMGLDHFRRVQKEKGDSVDPKS